MFEDFVDDALVEGPDGSYDEDAESESQKCTLIARGGDDHKSQRYRVAMLMLTMGTMVVMIKRLIVQMETMGMVIMMILIAGTKMMMSLTTTMMLSRMSQAER